MFIKTSILVCCLVLSGSLCAQPYYFRHYQVENGLSNNAVICSIQDKNGFLWFGTKDGLDRFDGYSFKVFRSNPQIAGSIGNNFMHSLYEDRNGTLWAGTENGLFKYNDTTESFTLLPGSENGPIRDINMDDKGNLWLIHGFTVLRYSARTKQLEAPGQNNHFEATSVCTTGDGAIWVSTTGGLLKKYNPASNSFADCDMFQHSKPVVLKWIEKICAAGGSILIGTSNQGVKIFDIQTKTYKDILTYNTDKTEVFVRNFVQANNGDWWIATESGIFIYNMQTGRTVNLQKKYNDPYSISDNAVYSFCKDREGGIWATSYFGGVNYYPAQNISFKKWFPKTGENSLSGNVVREIHEDRRGNLWIGTEDAGLNKYDTLAKTFTHYLPTQSKKSISYTNIHGLLVNDDQLWTGTFEHGLDVLSIKTGQVISHYAMGQGEHTLKSNFIYCIKQIDKGQIALGTARGAYIFNQKSNNFSPLAGLPQDDWYTCLLKDHKGILWAGTYGAGIVCFNEAAHKTASFRFKLTDNNSIASDRVNSIFEDTKNNLWFATEGGLCKLNKQQNSFKRYTTQNGMPSNFILSILEDDSTGNLWVSTSKGLVCVNPVKEEFVVYTRINGLLSDQFNFNSAFKDHNGTMYFGSVKGMISFNPGALSKNNFVPPVYITGFQVFNRELAIGEKGSPLTQSITRSPKITLTSRQSTFSIDFAALSYMAPEACEYAYDMEGLDNNWTYLKTNRKAYFTQLAPGTYTFKVKAANNSRVWNEKVTTLIIEILPPWWASMWAYAVYLTMAAAIVFYIVRSYHIKAEIKNRRKMEHLEIAKEKEVFQSKMEFFTNVAHEIRTPLTLIKGPLEKVIRKAGEQPEIKESLRIMERNTNRLIVLTSQLLDFRQTEIKGFGLNFVNANVNALLDEVCAEFIPVAEQKNISLQIGLTPIPIFAYLDAEAFTKIITNLLSNAIKYSAGRVVVLMAPVEKDTAFTVLFKNDGYIIPYDMRDKIFEPFFRLKETQKQKGTGIGLALSRSLAQLHNGAIALLQPEDGMNIFQLTLPMQQGRNIILKDIEPKNFLITALNNK